MHKQSAQWVGITGDQPITKQTDPVFYKNLQMGLIIALKDCGILSEEDFRKVMECVEA